MKYSVITLLVAGFAASGYASSCTVSPTPPSSGHPVTVIYDPAGGPLAAAGTVYIHKGINGWNPVDAVDAPMTLSNGVWTLTYLVPQWAQQLDYVFNNGSGIWDNNNGNDWHFSVPLPAVGAPPAMPGLASRAHVMMQGFYWNCPGGWYNNYLTPGAKTLRYMRGGHGIDRIWFPPPQKAASSWSSMGYDPYDYYDVGQYNQKGNTTTRFGTQAALINATAAFRAKGIVTMADLVLNHRDGGLYEANPNLGGIYTNTDFSFVASGRCTWHYNQFHPSTYESYDAGAFGSFQDVCHVTGDSPGAAYHDLIEWGQWLTNTANAGFDGGWRFDYPKGIHPSFIADFRKGTGDAFGIIEYWDGNISLIEDYVKFSGNTSAFDFPAFYTMIDVFNSGAHIGRLFDATRVYAAKDPDRAVTFVANHDTDKENTNITDKMLAYAYILTYQGYPCLFWRDYFNYGLATLGGQPGNGIKPLVWVRGALGGGEPDLELLKGNDSDFIIYGTLNGSVDAPGYIVAINTHASAAQNAAVTTANPFLRGKTLRCHAWYSYVSGQNVQPADISCSAGGLVTVQAPPRGYAVYSVITDLPAPWVGEDIGADGLEGQAIFVSDTFTLSGSGEAIGGTGDGSRYVYQTIDGDCGIQARIAGLENTASGAGTGLMIREDTATNAAHAAVWVTPESGVMFQWRGTVGSEATNATVGGVAAPCWVRLIRSDGIFHAYYSTDGTNWTPVGSGQSIGMSSGALVGMAATSGANDMVNTCVLDNVSINRAPVPVAISNRILVAGNTLTITNAASDADLPAQILTQSPVDTPAGSSFNAANGEFVWRPLIEQSPSTQTVALAVADDGLPPLTAINRFDVTVLQPALPNLGSAGVTNDAFGFWIGGDAGPDYAVLGSTNLVDGEWVMLFSTNSPVLPFFWSSPTSEVDRAEFFKVQLGP